MLQRAKDVVKRQIKKRQRKRQKTELIAAGGAPADWYDAIYSDSELDVYTTHYSESKYLPVWESICERIPKGARILEIGCGPAQFARMLLDRGIPSEYVGFDFSPTAIAMAKQNLPDKRLEVADARTTDLFTSVDYDLVVCTEVLEHIIDDLPVIQRIPKGKHVLATVPNFDYESHVRYFTNASEVRGRYGFLFESLDITEHHHAGDQDGSRGTFFLLDGARRA